MPKIYLTLVGIALLAFSSGVVRAGYVLPQFGGGQAGQVNAPMKHADITLIGTSLNVHIDSTVPTPLLRSLTSPDEFDLVMPWSVLQEKAHNFQYGWNASGFWAPPLGTAIWIEQLDISPGLEVYYVAGLPVSPPYDPIFGTEETSTRWKWDGFMTHNAYAVLNPTESTYQATYKVYLGDQETGLETPGYTGTEVQFDFTANPILTADFNEDQSVDAADLTLWQQNFGTTSGGTNSLGDTDSDGDVDGQDFLNWQRQRTGQLALKLSPSLAVSRWHSSLLACGRYAVVANNVSRFCEYFEIVGCCYFGIGAYKSFAGGSGSMVMLRNSIG